VKNFAHTISVGAAHTARKGWPSNCLGCVFPVSVQTKNLACTA